MRTPNSKIKRKGPRSRPAGSRGDPSSSGTGATRRRHGVKNPPPKRRHERSKPKRPHRHRPLSQHAKQNIARPLDNVIRVSNQSIHNGWKRELGGLIRWYVNLPVHRQDPELALETVEGLYRSNRCNIEATKHALLESIATAQGIVDAPSDIDHGKAWIDHGKAWITLRMVVENPQEITASSQDSPNACTIDGITYETIRQGRGVVLKVERRPGEGPAHAVTIWDVVQIPQWAVNRPYYFEAVNQSSLDLSCEMSIDGHSAAKNAPIPSLERRTIQPAVQRYFESHEWRLAPATRIGLQQASVEITSTQNHVKVERAQRTQQGERYNERRPNYHGERVSEHDFPEPSGLGWTFTGSNELSKVEFFEKRLNNGSVCKMDFYYTTATVKTTLYHPVQQRTTQLFRRCLQSDPSIYLQILNNPRYHSNLGYSRQLRVPPLIPKEEMDGNENDDTMEDVSTVSHENANEVSGVPYFAKNADYAFDTAGHENRKSAMSKLQPTCEFKAWEKATKQDWACIHAKFFVSMRRYLRTTKSQHQQGPRIKKERIHLPEMKPVIQVQAAKNAVIATRFHSTGPAIESKQKSRVRMERIPGLNDDPGWGTGPVFDVKLYYRLETALGSHGGVDVIDEAMIDSDDEGSGEHGGNEVPLAEKLRDNMPLDEYKAEKVDQLYRWYKDCKVRDRNEGNARVTQTQHSIGAAESTQAVDECLKGYWDWHIQQELS